MIYGYTFKKISILVICSWLLLTTLIIIVPVDSDAATILPIATLGLDQPCQTADVSPNGTGMVEFTGTVDCELNSFTTAIVSLECEDTWNSSTITPTEVQFSSSDRGTKVFRVSVIAPKGTSRNEVGMVVVTGQVVMYPGSLHGTCHPSDGVVGRIDIAPFFEFSVYSEEKYLETSPGRAVRYDLTIENNGNIDDIFQISNTNYNQLFNNGILVNIEPEQIDIKENREKKVDITIEPSEGSSSNGKYEIQCEVISLGWQEQNESCPSKCQNFELNIMDAYGLKDQWPDDNGNGNANTLDEDDLESIEEIRNEESSEFILPGFETVSLIICTLILIFIIRRSDRYRRC